MSSERFMNEASLVEYSQEQVVDKPAEKPVQSLDDLKVIASATESKKFTVEPLKKT